MMSPCICHGAKFMQCREPIVLPFYHSGMGRILPKGSVIPRIGHTVNVTVGQPIELSDLTAKCNCNSCQQPEVALSSHDHSHDYHLELFKL